MKKPSLLLAGAEFVLIATAILFLAFRDLWNTLMGVSCVVVALVLVGWLVSGPVQKPADSRTVAVGTVCGAGNRHITIQVTGVHGDTFIGRLMHYDGDPAASWLRPGAILLVAFDPIARERLSLPDDVLAVRAADVCST
jgi:hypothetical protein